MALFNELADESDFELQRFSETMQRRFAEQCDVLAAQFTHNQTGIRIFRCLVCGLACSKHACRSHADPGKGGDKSHDSRYSDQNHNRHDIRDRLVARSMGTTPAGKNAFAVPRFRPYNGTTPAPRSVTALSTFFSPPSALGRIDPPVLSKSDPGILT